MDNLHLDECSRITCAMDRRLNSVTGSDPWLLDDNVRHAIVIGKGGVTAVARRDIQFTYRVVQCSNG